MSKDITEKALVGKFVLWAAELEDGRGALCGPEHVEAIKAAAERIARQAIRNVNNGRRGGRPVEKDDEKARKNREAKRRQRAQNNRK